MSFLVTSGNILLFICGLGILQGLLMAGMIYFHPKSQRPVKFFLSMFIASVALVMSTPLVHQLISWKHCFFLEALTFLPAPLLYIYVRSLKESLNWQKILPHLLPFLLYGIFSFYYFQYIGDKYPDSPIYPVEQIYSPISFLMMGLRYSQMLIYYLMSLYMVKNYRRSIRLIFSEISHIDLKWVNWLIHGFLVIIISTVLIYGLMMKYPGYFYQLFLLNIALVTPYIYITTYKGITQPSIWQRKKNGDKREIEVELNQALSMDHIQLKNRSQKQLRNNLQDPGVDGILCRVYEIMDQDKLYQETELTLKDLAEKIEMPSYRVSQALNEGMNKSFYELVNSYRVEEAKRLLVEPGNENFTILSIGFEAGFNSKTTFNTVFKKFTGLTPTEYRDRQKTYSISA